jgi:PncC family amidohydrolase
LARKALDALRSTGRTLAVAESCSGGLICHLLTAVPGCSEVLLLGCVAYSNAAKTDVLGVESGLLDRYGAVSEPVAMAMATGVAAVGHADVGVATSGLAGPSGGTPDKPVGTVCFALADGDSRVTERLRFDGDRASIKLQAARWALERIRRHCDSQAGEREAVQL